MATLSERNLVERLRQRDEAAFNEMVHLYADTVLEHVRLRIADPAVAADLVQDVFVSAFRGTEHAPHTSGLFLWLCSIADDQSKRHPAAMSK